MMTMMTPARPTTCTASMSTIRPMTSSTTNVAPLKRKFRFDSFASEFEEKVDIQDDDSGIDSEETQISPPLNALNQQVQQVEPLSLVLRRQQDEAQTPVRHWKKFLKDIAEDDKVEEQHEEENQQAENLCIRNIKQEKEPQQQQLVIQTAPNPAPVACLLSPVTSVAHALLSLAKPTPIPARVPVVKPDVPFIPEQKVYHNLPIPMNHLPKQPFRPIPLSASALRPLQSSQILNRNNAFNSFQQQQQQQQRNLNQQPENLCMVKLPQHPVAPSNHHVTNNVNKIHHSSSSSAFFQLQSMTMSSTATSSTSSTNTVMNNHVSSSSSGANSAISSFPLREINDNYSTALRLEQQPRNKFNTVSLPQTPVYVPNNAQIHKSPLISPNSTENQEKRLSKSSNSNQQQPKPFHCLECKKSFSTQSGYAKHQQLHCNNQIQKSFSCKYCNKGYTSLSALKMHIRTHTLPCKCDVCGKSFSRPWLLQGHVRTHTGEKPFSCNYCTRSFADKSNLRAHLQTHLQTKKYQCPGCKKTFSRMSLLNKHTDTGCHGLESRNEECVQTLIGLSSGGLMRS